MRWSHVCAAAALASALLAEVASADVSVAVTYLRQEVERPPVLSGLDPVPEDLGLAGAELAQRDNVSTGRFLGHDYSLEVVSVAPGGDLLDAARQALAASPLLLVEAPAADLLAVADLAEAQGALIINVAAGEAALRGADCRANVLHVAPEMGMKADALMQVLQGRRWTDTVMIVGPTAADRALAAEYRRAAAKFGIRIRAEKDWTFDTDLRESTWAEMPRFTQDLPDHHVLLVADAADDFARYVLHNTWRPRPVAGGTGLVADSWAPVVEAWGAAQLQRRFERAAGRKMRGADFDAWTAIRALGEAVTRTGAADPAALRAYLLSPDFALDVFKGRPASFRPWNGQLRQPMAVANDRALVLMAPVEGFLHRVNELDTLGTDEPESACRAFVR